jgi:general secretion pathway protein G
MAKGFSLFEMVIVMGIIGLILSSAIFMMGGLKGSAAVTTAEGDLQNFETSLERYRDLAGNYPTTEQGLEALYEKPTGAPRPRRWVQLVTKLDAFKDPWKNKYKYQFPGSKNKNAPEIISAGPDGDFGTEDDMSNQD